MATARARRPQKPVPGGAAPAPVLLAGGPEGAALWCQLAGLAGVAAVTFAATLGLWVLVLGLPPGAIDWEPPQQRPQPQPQPQPQPPPPPPPRLAPAPQQASQEDMARLRRIGEQYVAMTRLAGQRRPVVVGMQPTPVTGWGKLSAIVVQALYAAGYYPIVTYRIDLSHFERSSFSLDPGLKALLREQDPHAITLGQLQGLPAPVAFPCPVVVAIQQFFLMQRPFRSTTDHNLGFIFFTTYPETVGELERQVARGFDTVITGSTYNHRALQAMDLGPRVENLIQGVDTAWFDRSAAPAGAHALFPGRFVVFSGGKFEERKAQDLVLAAFLDFAAARPEAILVTTWRNMHATEFAHVYAEELRESSGLYTASGRLAPPHNVTMAGIADWTRRNGLADRSVRHFDMLAEEDLRDLLARADLAVFPNRGEPGTNLVAMEALAMGVPCIIANNTGQADIARPDISYVLESRPGGLAGSRRHYGQSRVGDIVDLMVEAYQNRDEARRRGERAAAFIRSRHTWRDYGQGFSRIFADMLARSPA